MATSLPTAQQLVESVSATEADELERVKVAVVLADDLGTLGDQVVTHFVESARASGCSWSQIGAQLGVSKQAAQQAFVAPAPRRSRFGRGGGRSWPSGRFGADARAAIVATRAEAAALGHNHVGTEHLLLALGSSPGLAGTALRQLGVDQDVVRRHVEEMIGRGHAGPSARRPFTPRTKKVLELAVREAIRLKSDHIDTEHLLLALVREGDGVAVQIVVQKLGIDLSEVSRAVVALINTGGRRTPGEPPTG